MAIKFSQFNERTESTATMSLVGYDGEQNIRILADDLLANPYINGTENTLAMFGTGGTIVVDSIVSQDAGATLLTVAGQLNVDAAATFDTSIEVTGDSTLNGNVILGDASSDLITQTGTLYLNGPIKDTTDTLGAADQVLVSDASGELTFTDLTAISTGTAQKTSILVKNIAAGDGGVTLTKGTPVYIVGSVGASERLYIDAADASNAAKMPCVGLLDQDLLPNGEGTATVTGKLKNLITSPIDGATPTENDTLYVKPGGGLTLTKPTGVANLIQNVGQVGRVSTSSDGNIVVSSILRTNDVPNLTQGKIWVGSTGNTIESSSITFTEATGAVQLNEYGVGSITGTAAYNLSVDASGNIIETTAVPGNIVETLTAASGTYISLTDATSATGDVDLGTFDLSAIDGSSDTTTRFLSKDNTWDIPSYTTVTTTDGTYINLTPNSATSGAVTVTADLSAVDGVAAVGERYLTKNNTWAEVATIPGTYTFNVSDGTASTTINSGDTLGILGGTYITTSNTTGNVTINHDATSRTDTTSTSTPGYGGTFTVVDSISTNATGHLEAINVKTVTMPPADDTNTTYDLSGFGTTNGTAGVQLIGSDGSVDQVAVTGAGTTTVVHSGNTLTITSNDQYTGTVTSVSGGTYITDTGTATDPVLNHDATSRTDTTSTDSPGVSGSFTAVDSVTTNATGHVTAINVKTVTLPDDGVDGSGTLNYVAKWTPDGDTLGDSIIYDDGTNVGVGTDNPASLLHIKENNTSTTSGLTIEQLGTGDAIAHFLLSGVQRWVVGADNSDSDKFKIASSSDLNTDARLTIETTGNVGIGTDSPRGVLDVNGPLSVIGGTFTSGTAGADSNTSAGIVLRRGKRILSGIPSGGNEDFYLRNLIWQTSSNNIEIGQSGTSLVGDISLLAGASGNIRFYASGSQDVVINSSGDVGIGTTNPGSKLQIGDATTTSNVAVRAISEEGYQAGFEAYGSNQGTGYMYVGQALIYGGGVAYNGDGSPAAFDSGHTGSDKITFFRRENSTDTAVMWYGYNSDDVNFRGNIKTSAYTIPNTAGTSGQVLKWPASGTTLEWGSASGSYTPSAISTNTNAVNNYLYILTANLTLTLPASPSAGDSIKIANFSGVTTCVIARNGNNIMASATDLTLDNDKANFELVYTDATRGWVIIGATGELN